MPRFDLRNIKHHHASSLADLPWSPQQRDVFAAVQDLTRGSLRIDAVAGAGKTTTLVHATSLIPSSERVAFGAFNKRIADEIKFKVSAQPHVTTGTMHSFGLRNWTAFAGGKAEIDGRKLHRLVEDLNMPYWLEAFTIFMVAQAKQHGFMAPVSRDNLQMIADHFDAMDKLPEDWESKNQDLDPFGFVNLLLSDSIDKAHEGLIDFDDMLYMPLRYGSISADYDRILVDEAQDTNTVRRELVRRMLKAGGKVIAVGDPHQAIYGFTGADADAMDLIQADFACEYLPLTVTYRCPKKIVEHAQQWVSHIEAAAEAPDGEVSDMDAQVFARLQATDLTGADAILCRNTRPLIATALGLIRRGIGARVEGRDIGQQLQALSKRWKTTKTLSGLRDRLEVYREMESRKLRNRSQNAKAAQVEDKVDSLIAVIESLPHNSTTFDLDNRIKTLFGDTEPGEKPRVVTLSTVHKAKGREWDRVYLLGRNELMPSRCAKQDWEKQQEANLIYVAVTRAKQKLIEVQYVG